MLVLRNLVALIFIGFLAFLLVARESPASLLSRLTVLFGGTDHARSVFVDKVPVAQVLASSASSSPDPAVPACRVAVVKLAEGASAKPPRVALIDQTPGSFGGNWRPTPPRKDGPDMPDLLALCGDRIDSITRKSLVQALAEPGSFVIRDWKNDTLQIYAPQRNLAAHLSLK